MLKGTILRVVMYCVHLKDLSLFWCLRASLCGRS